MDPKKTAGAPDPEFHVRDIAIAELRLDPAARPIGRVDQLAESIREFGLLNPVTVTTDLRLIAGQHRVAAFLLLGRERIPAHVLTTSELKAEMATLDENLLRCELTALERAEHLHRRKSLYETLYPDTRRGGNRGNQFTGGKKRQTAKSAFCQSAGAQMGRSDRTVRHYLQIARKLSGAAKDRVRATPLANKTDTLMRLSRLTERNQIDVVEVLLRGRIRSVGEALISVERSRRMAAAHAFVNTADVRLEHGDFRELAANLPDNSVDLILSDPPYAERDIEMFADLSALANRVLKPGASLFCMIGVYHLPKILQRLSAHLNYQWQITFLMAGNGAVVHGRRVISAYKPVLWFTKGTYKGPVFNDVLFGIGKDKRFHEWGQSEAGFDRLVERYSHPRDLILDPFLGGGTIAVVASRLGRRFLGFDISQDAVQITSARINMR